MVRFALGGDGPDNVRLLPPIIAEAAGGVLSRDFGESWSTPPDDRQSRIHPAEVIWMDLLLRPLRLEVGKAALATNGQHG